MAPSDKTASEIVAANLKQFMDEAGLTQTELAKRSRVAQTTISLYLRPADRKPGASGKPPSPKLEELDALAKALGCSVWQLTRDMSKQERAMYAKIEAAYRALVEGNDKPQHDPETP